MNLILIIIWVRSSIGRLFTDMTLTLHKSQVHCFGNVQLWACSLAVHSCPLCPQRQVAKLGSEFSTIGLCYVTIAWQQTSKMHFKLCCWAFCRMYCSRQCCHFCCFNIRSDVLRGMSDVLTTNLMCTELLFFPKISILLGSIHDF